MTSKQYNKELEYTQLNENLRNYHRHRFLQLTLWLAITAGLISILFGDAYYVSAFTRKMLKLIGIITSFVFFLMDLRMVDHWRHFYSRLKKIETEMGFRIWIDRPKRKWLGSTNATWFLYIAIITFWLAFLFWPSKF